MEKSKVYVRIDAQNRIIQCEGGVSEPKDLTGWIQIDEGYEGKYNLCQSNYFESLSTEDGIPAYRLKDNWESLPMGERTEERSAADLEKDRIEPARNKKISEIHAACNAVIVAGADIQLSSESAEHYDYKEKDQINIKEMFDAVRMGATEYPYQDENGNCRVYSAEEIIKIYQTLAGNKTAQQTYYNQLKKYINTLDSTEAIAAVTYGQPLTGEYLTHYNDMVTVAAAQMQNVLSNIRYALNL